MNTVDDLRAELRTLEADAPADADVRATLAERQHRRVRRRRTRSVVAAAVAVIVVATGATIAGVTLGQRTSGPAARPPVVQVPDVSLPVDSRLMRFKLPAVTTPVTATPPGGVNQQGWAAGPGRLTVSWFDSNAVDGRGMLSANGSKADDEPVVVGYVVSDHRSDDLTQHGPDGRTEPATGSRPITIGEHPAELITAPPGTVDVMGFPAEHRVVWQLTDGRWIHVWATGGAGSREVESFAATIVETPSPLYRTIGMGLTLPGYTAVWSMNPSRVWASSPASIQLCPPGVTPYLSRSGNGSSAGREPGDGEISPHGGCIVAYVAAFGADQVPRDPDETTVVDGITVHLISTVYQYWDAAWVDLGNGAMAMVQVPKDIQLGGADLPALAASVRLAPEVPVMPMTPEWLQRNGNTDAAQASSSAAASATAPPTADGALEILTAYLDALIAGDCATAEEYTADSFFVGNGELCGAVEVSAITSVSGAASGQGNSERIFSATLTTGGSDDGTIPAGDLIWFYTLREQPDGTWLITGGGSGP